MAFIESAYAEELTDKLCSDPSMLGKIYKAKSKKFLEKNVDHNLVKAYLEDGWEEYGTRLKTKTRLRKCKRHDQQFEDDVWCQVYKLGYRHLNISNDFRLPFNKDFKARKQIDVIAINDDSILLFECKSAEKPKKAPSYKTEFEGLPIRLYGFRKALAQLFGKDRKIKYVFATRQLRLDRSRADIQRLQETGSFYYNDNTYEYLNSLIQKYKDAAQYQFMATLFRGTRISDKAIKVPAVEGKMGKQKYYMFSLEPHLLLKLGYILHRTRANEAEMPTYQRLLNPNRLKGINKFINGGGYFPNSVIVNFNKEVRGLVFQPSKSGNGTISKAGILKIPLAYAIAYIIDGQHRVYGYASTKYNKTNTIPVVAFKGLSSHDQLKLFMEINENQKAVTPTLRITLEEDLYWDSDRIDSRMKALRSSVIQQLGGNSESVLHHKISLGEDKALLTAKPFSDALTRCGLLPKASGNSYLSNTTEFSLYDVNKHDHGEEMVKAKGRIFSLVNLCYEHAESVSAISEQYETVIAINRGSYAFVSLIGSLNTYVSEKNGYKPDKDVFERFEAIKGYLDGFFKELSTITPEDRAYLFGKLGTGAENKWFMFFQNLVNKQFNEFEPEALIDWKQRRDKDLQERGRLIGTEIEKFMKSAIVSNLKLLFRDNWELEIGAIQRKCEARAKEQMEKEYKDGLKKRQIPWTDQFFIMDYKKIIEDYWGRRPEEEVAGFRTFEEHFALDVGYGNKSKKEKMKWISVLNQYRNKWAHEGTKEEGLNKVEVYELERFKQELGI